MASSDYRFNRRSNKSVREQWGPTAEEERQEAMDRLIQSGRTPSSFGSVKNFESAVREEVNSAREARGPMAYDQSQGKMIPSPKARRERLSAELDTAEKAKTEAKKKGDEDWKKEVLQEFVTEAPARSGTTKDGSMFQSETPSGGYVSARSGSKNGIDVSTNMVKSRDSDREVADRNERFQTALAENRQRAAMTRLTDSGYDWKSADSSELFKKDGSLNLDKAKRAADLAQGQKAQETFAAWDTDKRLDRLAVMKERDDRRRLSDLRSARVPRYGDVGRRAGRDLDEAEMAEMRQLESNIKQGEEDRGGLNAGFYRRKAEEEDRTNIAAAIDFNRRAEAQRKQSQALQTKIQAGENISDEQLRAANLPARDDEEAWNALIESDPTGEYRRIYNSVREVKTSRAGNAMSRAFAAALA